MTVGRANLYKITARFVEESRYNSDIYEKSICRHTRILLQHFQDCSVAMQVSVVEKKSAALTLKKYLKKSASTENIS